MSFAEINYDGPIVTMFDVGKINFRGLTKTNQGALLILCEATLHQFCQFPNVQDGDGLYTTSRMSVGDRGQGLPIPLSRQDHFRVASDMGLVGAALQTGELINVPDAHEDPR